MHDRKEPRFWTDTPAIIQAMRDEASEIECRITDVSALGFQVSVSEPLQPGEYVRLAIDGTNAIGVVRRCEPLATGFTIGLERVDEWVAGGNGNASGKSTKPGTLKNPIGSLRSSALHNLFGNKKPAVKKNEKQQKRFTVVFGASALLAVFSVGYAVMPHKGSTGNQVVTKNDSAAQTAQTSEQKPKQTNEPVVTTTPASVNPADTATAVQPSTSPASPSVITDEGKASSAAVNPSVAPSKGPSVAVTEAAKKPAPPAISLAASKPVAATPVVVAARTAAPAAPVATSASVRPSPATASTPAPAAAPLSTTKPVASEPGKTGQPLTIQVSEMSWVAVCADGKKVFEGVLQPGSKSEFKYSEEAVVRAGNAGALEITKGAQHLAAMGPRGQTRWLKATKTSLDSLSTRIPGPCAGK